MTLLNCIGKLTYMHVVNYTIKVLNNMKHFQEVAGVRILSQILIIPGSCMDQKVLYKLFSMFENLSKKSFLFNNLTFVTSRLYPTLSDTENQMLQTQFSNLLQTRKVFIMSELTCNFNPPSPGQHKSVYTSNKSEQKVSVSANSL